MGALALGIGVGMTPVAAGGSKPTNTAAPSIANANANAVEGSLWVATPGVWSGATTVTGQWYNASGAIVGATNLSYTTTVNDVVYTAGSPTGTIFYRETATNAAGTATADSSPSPALKNGIVAQIIFKSTAADPSTARWTYSNGAKWGLGSLGSPTTDQRGGSGGPSGFPGYVFGWANAALPAFSDGSGNGTYPELMKGGATLSGSGTSRFYIQVPKGVALKYRVWSGVGATVSHELRDGDNIISESPGTLITNTDVAPTATASGVATVATVLAADHTPSTPFVSNYNTSAYQDLAALTNTLGSPSDLPAVSNVSKLVLRRQTAGNTGNYQPRAIQIVYPEMAQVTSGTGPYYVDAVSGSDTNDGLTTGTAWQHGPGDPGAGGILPGFTVLPGGSVLFKKGQRHRVPSFTVAGAERLKHLYTVASGTNGNPVTYGAYGSGANPILDGSELITTGWSSASSDALLTGNPNKANVEKRSTTNVKVWSQTIGDGEKQLYPAQWPYCDNPADYEHSYPGAQGYATMNLTEYTAAVVDGGDGSGATGSKRRVTINSNSTNLPTNANTLQGQYATDAVNLTGWPVVIRVTGSRFVEAVILSHNTATGQIVFDIPNASITGQAPQTPSGDGSVLFQYAIRYHPYDIRKAGLFGWDNVAPPMSRSGGVTKVLYGHFNNSAATRAIARLEYGLLPDRDYLTFDGIDLQRFGVYDGHAFNDNGIARTGIVFKNGGWQQCCADQQRFSGKIQMTATDWTFANTFAADNKGGGGIELPQVSASSDITLLSTHTARTMGGSPFFATGTHQVLQDLDNSDNATIHGNAITLYNNFNTGKARRFYAMNNSIPIAMQQLQGGTITRNNSVTQFVATARQPYSGQTQNPTSLIINDSNNELGTLFQYGVAVGKPSFFGTVTTGGAGPSFKNMVFSDLSMGDATGYSFENCYVMREQSLAPAGGVGSLPHSGAAPTDVGGNVFEASPVSWTGVLTLKMQKALTANGQLGTYSPVVLGPSWNPWNVPAWTGFVAGSLSDCSATSSDTTVASSFNIPVPLNWRANLAFSSIVNTSPGVTISLPAGVNDNNSFTLSVGQLSPNAQLTTATTYHVTVRQDNGAGVTKDTTFNIIVS